MSLPVLFYSKHKHNSLSDKTRGISKIFLNRSNLIKGLHGVKCSGFHFAFLMQPLTPKLVSISRIRELILSEGFQFSRRLVNTLKLPDKESRY